MNKIPISVQMFSLREESEADFAGTLKKVAELGYDGVEFAGYGGLTAKEVRELLDQYGLQAVSSHIPLDQLINSADQVIADLKIIGRRYLVCPFFPPASRTSVCSLHLVCQIEALG